MENNIDITNLLIDYANKNNIILEINNMNNNEDCPLLTSIDNNSIEMTKLLIDYVQKHNIVIDDDVEKEIQSIIPNYKKENINSNDNNKYENGYEINKSEIEKKNKKENSEKNVEVIV